MSGDIAAPGPRARPARLPHFAAIICIVAIALASYWGTLHNPLVFDDRMLRHDFLQHYASSWFRFELRWISHASFGWIYRIAGADWFWQRLANVLLHGAVAAALFLFLARLFELTARQGGAASLPGVPHTRWIALFGAIIFLLHPVAAYAVAYLVQRSILLAVLFSLVSLSCFLEGLHRKAAGWHLAAVIAYLAAVFSKEHAVMLPAVAMALAWLVRGCSLRLLRELWWPSALSIAIAVIVTLKAQGKLGVPYEPFVQSLLQRSGESHSGIEPGSVFSLSVLNQTLLYFDYLLVWLIPNTGWMSVDLRPPFPAVAPDWPYFAGLLGYATYPAAAGIFLLRGSGSRVIAFGLLSPWLLALTEVSTVRVQEPFVLYRSYLWMPIFAGALSLLVARVARGWTIPVLTAVSVALVPPLLNRLDTFSTPARLWDDAIAKQRNADAPLVERAWHNRGIAHLQAGQHAEALRDFNRAIELNVRNPDAHLGRGVLWSRSGRHGEALADLDRAVELDPRYAEAYAKRCFVKMMLEKPSIAVADCERAVQLDPRHRDAQTNLGVVYAALGRAHDAESSYRRALEIDPGNGDANYNYAVLLAATGRMSDARKLLGIACKARVAAACRKLGDTK